MQITHKKATGAEKRELKKIAAELPDIIVPIKVDDFRELNGEIVPIVDMGRINVKGHFHNLVDSMESGGVQSVREYVDAVHDRHQQNIENDKRTGEIK